LFLDGLKYEAEVDAVTGKVGECERKGKHREEGKGGRHVGHPAAEQHPHDTGKRERGGT